MPCNTGCMLYGAHRTAISIKDSAVLLHSPVGCNYATLLGYAPSHNNDIRQACTYMIERDVIYGGSHNLEACINKVIETFDYSVLFVLTSCVPELTGDSCAAVISGSLKESAHINAKKPIILIESPGFKGDEWSGILETMLQIISRAEPKPLISGSINLIGLFESDYKVDGDLRQIREMLGGVKINCVFPYDTYDNITSLSSAQLNVVFHGFSPIGDVLKERFGTPYIEVDYPYGIFLSRAFVDSILDGLGLNGADKLDGMERYTLKRLGDAQQYIELLCDMPVAVIGYPARVHSLRRLLKEELGMDVAMAMDRTLQPQKSVVDAIAESGAVLLFACGHEAPVADRLGIAFIEYEYPAMYNISISENGYAGFGGYVNFVEDIVNTLIRAHFSEAKND